MIVKINSDASFLIRRDAFESCLIKSFGWAKESDCYALTIETKSPDFICGYFTVESPPQLVIDFRQQSQERIAAGADGSEAPAKEEKKEPPSLPAPPPSIAPAASLYTEEIRTIVIDPGHGGLYPGSRGRYGTLEKDVVLAVSLRLKEIIERTLAIRVVLTRTEDVDVPLENRAAKANNEKADLFISIHANSSFRRDARGSETFFLSQEASDEEARRLAYLENNPAELEEGISGQNEDEIKMILWDMAQSAYLRQSSSLAESIQSELNELLRTRNRGIKQAPFKVLSGVACPAVLVEVAFLSNPDEERRLLTADFQQRVAQEIYDGLVNYMKLNSQK